MYIGSLRAVVETFIITVYSFYQLQWGIKCLFCHSASNDLQYRGSVLESPYNKHFVDISNGILAPLLKHQMKYSAVQKLPPALLFY